MRILNFWSKFSYFPFLFCLIVFSKYRHCDGKKGRILNANIFFHELMNSGILTYCEKKLFYFLIKKNFWNSRLKARVRLQVKTLLLCILLSTPEIEIIYYRDYRKFSCNNPEICNLNSKFAELACYHFFSSFRIFL